MFVQKHWQEGVEGIQRQLQSLLSQLQKQQSLLYVFLVTKVCKL